MGLLRRASSQCQSRVIVSVEFYHCECSVLSLRV